MKNHRLILPGLIAAGLLALPVRTWAQQPDMAPSQTVEDIQQALLRLPYYAVFDFLAFKYDKGTVTLSGYAYALSLKQDAERAVKRVAGVDQVVNDIEELPVSPNDTELRWRTFYTIYTDPFLSRYAPGGGLLFGFRHPFRHRLFGPLGPGSRFAGMEPVGNYPIHIIVDRGHVTLVGVVANETDKTVAGLRAREVFGNFGVENDLMVEPTT